MKLKALALAAVAFCAAFSLGKNPPASGTIISQESVDCGTKNHGKKSSTPVLCQQYVVHTATTEYKIRQPKPSDSNLIPPNTPIQFTIDKTKMKFKVNDKSYEYLIVGTSALSAATK